MSENIHARGTFEIVSWEQAPLATSGPAEGLQLQRAEISRTFAGDFTGTSAAVLLMCQSDDENMGYVGSDHLTGTLDGRAGSFVVHHGGVVDEGTPRVVLGSIVPGSGRGELAGIRGDFVLTREDSGQHVFTLDYTLPESAGNP
ncbi:DUF3224 domain-containing protein [Streptomyces specialis]|uniref:DUF3224 domain-containing protein n=1 Tax=Streptomyces specialis TaxID=498367 RepID=UPI00073E3DDE|nr:DUF3224 domain-containing protein [Streptomyces specialis]